MPPRALTLALLFFLTGSLLGCAPDAGDPAPAPSSAAPSNSVSTATALFATPTSVPAHTATPLPTVTFLPDVYGIYGVDDGILLGGVHAASGEWISQGNLSASRVIRPLAAYQQGTGLGELEPGKVTGLPCPDTGKAEQVASLASMYPAHPFNGLAVSTSPWQPVPEGTIIWLAAPGSAYQEAARDFLIALHITADRCLP